MKRFMMTSLLVVLLTVLTLSFHSTAFAATLKGSPVGKKEPTALSPRVTCSQNGCNGLDPVATSCSATAFTVLSKPIMSGSQTVGVVNLRYSSACGTNWAQVLSYIGTVDFSVDIIRAGGADGPMLGYCAGSDFCSGDGVVGSTYAYTYMVWAADVDACADGGMIDSNSGQTIGEASVSQSSSLNC